MKKYRKLLIGLEKSGKPPASDGTAKRSILCLIRFFDSTILDWSSVASSDSALKYSSEPNQIISSSSCCSLKGDIYSGNKNLI